MIIVTANDTDEIYNALRKIPNYNVFRHNEIPERFEYKHNIRIGSLVIIIKSINIFIFFKINY
jgi:hypothetical protein